MLRIDRRVAQTEKESLSINRTDHPSPKGKAAGSNPARDAFLLGFAKILPSHFPWETWLDKQYEHIKPIETKKGKGDAFKKSHKVIESEGEGEQLDEVELPLNIAQRVDSLPELRIMERPVVSNPDLWSENDEFCLMHRGHLDFSENSSTDKVQKKLKYFFDTLEDIG